MINRCLFYGQINVQIYLRLFNITNICLEIFKYLSTLEYLLCKSQKVQQGNLQLVASPPKSNKKSYENIHLSRNIEC